MAYIIVLLGIIVLLRGITYMFINPRHAILCMILLICLEFNFSMFISKTMYQAAFKLIILFCVVRLFFISRKRLSKLPIILSAILLFISFWVCFEYNVPNFGVGDILTSYASLITGLLLLYVKWGAQFRIDACKVMSWQPILSTVLGIISNGQIFSTNKADGLLITGLNSAAVLVMISGLSIISSYILISVFQEKKYFWILLVDFAICGLCNMRGGLLFAVLVIWGISYPHCFKVPSKILKKLVLLFPPLFIVFIFVVRNVINKTINSSYSVTKSLFNTSNRIYAWTNALEYTKAHRILGWGIGYTKKVQGPWVKYGFQAIHNEYIRWIMESGILGLLIIIICFTIIFHYMYKHNIGIRKSVLNMIVIAFAVFSFTDNTMYNSAFWMEFTFLISILISDTSNKDKMIQLPDRRIKRWRNAG